MANGNIGLLQCKVSGGMFKGEKIVVVHSRGRSISAIVNEKKVKNNHAIEVEICGRGKNGYLVRLPGESFSTRKVWVSEDIVE